MPSVLFGGRALVGAFGSTMGPSAALLLVSTAVLASVTELPLNHVQTTGQIRTLAASSATLDARWENIVGTRGSNTLRVGRVDNLDDSRA